MSGPWPKFWSQPIRYMKWAATEKPALFWSTVVGAIGPLSLPIYRPIKTYLTGWQPRERIPVSYPIPSGERQTLDGYGDETEDQWHWKKEETKEQK